MKFEIQFLSSIHSVDAKKKEEEEEEEENIG
jgi:hypothetical protein